MITETRPTWLLSSRDVIQNTARSAGGTISAPLADQCDHQRWDDAIDAILAWRGSPADMDVACLDSAIDFAYDQRAVGAPSPTSVFADENGEVAFEWTSPARTTIVTILECGAAEFVVLANGEVVSRARLTRDPQTRKLELTA